MKTTVLVQTLGGNDRLFIVKTIDYEMELKKY